MLERKHHTGVDLPDFIWINDEKHAAASGESFFSLDPATAKPLGAVPAGDAEDIDRAVQAATAALEGPWASLTPKTRGQILQNIAYEIRKNIDRLAQIESLDVGKPINQARRDIERAATYFDYYGGVCDKLQGESIPLGPDYVSFTELEPIGVTGHIAPWNFPLPMLTRSLAPALACGNTAVVKPAEQAPLSALVLAELMAKAGLPKGVCNIVTGFGNTAGAALSAHAGIGHITFTGSGETGKLVMQAAAAHIAPVTLELGGKAPVIICADADIDWAVKGLIRSSFTNAGQMCNASTRIIVERSIHETFRDRLVSAAKAITLGHGLDDPGMGPLVSQDQLHRVKKFVDTAKAQGLNLLTGGDIATVPGFETGFFFSPTIFDNVPSEAEIAQEEVFGPVLSLHPADDLDHAIALANATRYGLSAGIYTKDVSAALRFARQIKAGQVFINEYGAANDVVPFGGFKQSGIGRQKGLAALHNYYQIKAITARI